MHFLTGIIVKDNMCDYSCDDARLHANSVLEEYEGVVWDWYENGSGRWSGEYGNGVFHATSRKFFDVLESLIESQKSSYEFSCKNLEDIDYYKNMYESKVIPDNGKDRGGLYLKWFADLVCGKFNSDSHIFDSDKYTSFITDNMISEYRNEPKKYWLVLFDVHN